MATSGSSCLVSSCRISHFGINPVKGGSPARDKIESISKAVRVGAFGHAKAKVLIFVAEISFSAINTVEVIKI